MMSIRLPPKANEGRIRICIVAEGYEEELYLKRLIELNVWSKIYDVRIVNAKSITNVAATYQNYYSNGIYRLILVFCDTDRAPFQQYREMKRQISLVHDGELATAEKVIIYANPCTMQIVLSHFSDGVTLQTQNKNKNAPLIAQLTGVQKYHGRQDQIEAICRQIRQQNYYDMQERVERIRRPDDATPSSNFVLFLEHLQSDDCGWIDELNNSLDME